MAHGAGGRESERLFREIFGKHFKNRVLDELGDAAVLKAEPYERIAFTTDSFVVTPLIFPGGDIGKLAVCGSVNDLLMMGARPKFLSAAFIMEEGLSLELLETVAKSMAAEAERAGAAIVCGDTKVLERRGGKAEGAQAGLYINTSALGYASEEEVLGAGKIEAGDRIIVSGNLGEHHAAIMSARLGIENGIRSDCAVLTSAVTALRGAPSGKSRLHAARDITRGGLATVLNELSESSGLAFEIDEEGLPISNELASFAALLGLDPLYMGNEGKLVAFVSEEEAEEALNDLRKSENGNNAAIVGRVLSEGGPTLLRTKIGGKRRIGRLSGEGLPRIC